MKYVDAMFAVWVTSQTSHKSYCGHKSQRGCLPSDPVTIIADRTTGAAAVDVITGSECNITIRHSDNESREANTPISFCVCPLVSRRDISVPSNLEEEHVSL